MLLFLPTESSASLMCFLEIHVLYSLDNLDLGVLDYYQILRNIFCVAFKSEGPRGEISKQLQYYKDV